MVKQFKEYLGKFRLRHGHDSEKDISGQAPSHDALWPESTLVDDQLAGNAKDDNDDLASSVSSFASTVRSYDKAHSDKDTIARETTKQAPESDAENDGSTSSTEEDFPEGGLRAWSVVFGAFCGLVACFGLLNTTGVLETYIQKNQLVNESSSTIGWIFSIMLLVCFGSCVFSGIYFDRNGFKKPMIIGTIFHVAGLIGTANSTKLWHFFLAFSLCCGFGNGIAVSPLVSVSAHYFSKRRGLAIALSTVGGSIGGSVFPIMLRKFFGMESQGNDSYFGYVWGVRTLALVNLFLLILSIIICKERVYVKDDEATLKKMQKWPRWKKMINIYLLNSFDAKAFLDKRYLFCVIGTSFGELSLCCAITYFGSYVTHQGISQSDAYMLIMVINLMGIPGRWIPGLLSDYFGRFNVAIITLYGVGIVMLVGWLPFGKSLKNMYAISAFYGFFSGSIFSLLPVCCGQISKTEEFGKRYATMYCVVSLATLVSIPITGAIIGKGSSGGYDHYVLFCGLTAMASATSYVISRAYCVGWKMVRF